MEQEKFFSGYCRIQDGSRMVCAVFEDGKLLEADCSFAGCPFTGECTIGQSIQSLLQDP